MWTDLPMCRYTGCTCGDRLDSTRLLVGSEINGWPGPPRAGPLRDGGLRRVRPLRRLVRRRSTGDRHRGRQAEEPLPARCPSPSCDRDPAGQCVGREVRPGPVAAPLSAPPGRDHVRGPRAGTAGPTRPRRRGRRRRGDPGRSRRKSDRPPTVERCMGSQEPGRPISGRPPIASP